MTAGVNDVAFDFVRVAAVARSSRASGKMETGRLADKRLTTFVAADHAASKLVVLELATAIGFEAVDAGPLANARLLEPLGFLNIQLGYVLGLGTQIGLKLLRA